MSNLTQNVSAPIALWPFLDSYAHMKENITSLILLNLKHSVLRYYTELYINQYTVIEHGFLINFHKT